LSPKDIRKEEAEEDAKFKLKRELEIKSIERFEVKSKKGAFISCYNSKSR
jgi:hypothetical protein